MSRNLKAAQSDAQTPTPLDNVDELLNRGLETLNLAESEQVCEWLAQTRGFSSFEEMTLDHLRAFGLSDKETVENP